MNVKYKIISLKEVELTPKKKCKSEINKTTLIQEMQGVCYGYAYLYEKKKANVFNR